jgi:hypothetical protein
VVRRGVRTSPGQKQQHSVLADAIARALCADGMGKAAASDKAWGGELHPYVFAAKSIDAWTRPSREQK